MIADITDNYDLIIAALHREVVKFYTMLYQIFFSYGKYPIQDYASIHCVHPQFVWLLLCSPVCLSVCFLCLPVCLSVCVICCFPVCLHIFSLFRCFMNSLCLLLILKPFVLEWEKHDRNIEQKLGVKVKYFRENWRYVTINNKIITRENHFRYKLKDCFLNNYVQNRFILNIFLSLKKSTFFGIKFIKQHYTNLKKTTDISLWAADFFNVLRFYDRRPPSLQNSKDMTDIMLWVSILGLFWPLISIMLSDFMSADPTAG